MQQVMLFTLVGIALYFFADWLLRRIEAWYGKPVPHRDLIYFAIILVLAMLSFGLLENGLP